MPCQVTRSRPCHWHLREGENKGSTAALLAWEPSCSHMFPYSCWLMLIIHVYSCVYSLFLRSFVAIPWSYLLTLEILCQIRFSFSSSSWTSVFLRLPTSRIGSRARWTSNPGFTCQCCGRTSPSLLQAVLHVEFAPSIRRLSAGLSQMID